MAESPVIDRVRAIVDPIVADLGLELYDCEFAGGVLRVAIDTPPGSESGVDLEALALATRLISREFDHTDPVPGRYTLEVTSPGLERPLRLPHHFQREIGKKVAVRLRELVDDRRRLQGDLVAADDTTATVRTDTGDVVIPIDLIDRARTVFEWGPQPKPGKARPAGSKTTPKSTEAHA
jgi:ribosome maturation factor RimP